MHLVVEIVTHFTLQTSFVCELLNIVMSGDYIVMSGDYIIMSGDYNYSSSEFALASSDLLENIILT